MSEEKNGVSPFRNKEYLQSSSSQNNKFKKQVTSEDIAEFKKAFSDEDIESTRAFSAPTEEAPAPENVQSIAPAQSYTKNEELYAVQSIDIDAFLQSLGGTPMKEEKKQASAAPDASETIAFTIPKTQAKESASQRTRHFNLNDALKSKRKGAASKKSDLIKGVRVLSGSDAADEPILEHTPDEDEKENVLDSVNPENGQDLFEAVDNAVKKKKNFAKEARLKAQKRARKKKEEEVILTGKALIRSLSQKSGFEKIRLYICLGLLFVSLIFTVLPSFYSQGNALEGLFANGGRIYAVINIILLLPLIALFRREYVSALESLRDMNPNGNVVLFIVSLFVLLHDIVSLSLGTAGLNGVRMYTCFAIFTAAATCTGKYFKTRTALRSIITVMKSKTLQSVQPVENKADANALAIGITDKGDPNILYCAEVEMGDSLSSKISTKPHDSKFYTYSSIAVLVLGFVTALAIYISTKDAGSFLTVLLSSVCLCMPVTADTAEAVLGYFENLKFNSFGAAATEYEGIRSVGKANGVAMDISDIFTADVSAFRLAPGAFLDKTKAAVYASAVTIGANALTGKAFEEFMKQTGAEMPVTENVQYEEHLGYSAWVDGKRVLVGNREMLIQHSIPAPDEMTEKKYAKGKFVMYLVVEGQLTASFLVNYRVLSSIKKLAPDFNRTGLVLMLTSKEPFLTNKEIAKRLSVDTAGIKVLSTKASNIMNEYRRNKAMRISNGLVCSEKSRSLLPLVVGAHNLYTSEKFIYNVHLLGQIAGFVLIVLSLLLNMPIFFSPFTIILLQLIWSGGSYFLCTKRK